MKYNPRGRVCVCVLGEWFQLHYHTFPFWREKKFDRKCKMATSSDVMTAAVGRVWGLSKGGSGLKPLQGASTGGPGYLRKRTSVNIGRMCPGR